MTVDLHVHSCLSPCADDSMTPALIAGIAALNSINAVALTDHNSCENYGAFEKAARAYGVLPVPAMELTTSEEVHILCYFSCADSARAFSDYVFTTLPEIKPDPVFFGKQLKVDENDEITGMVEQKLLSAASGIGVYDLARLSEKYGFFAVPAHIDKPSFSLLSNLGFYDPSMGFSLFEVSARGDARALIKTNRELCGMKYITGSDAHSVESLPDEGVHIKGAARDAAEFLELLKNGHGLPFFDG